jgi:hypothetical protein
MASYHHKSIKQVCRTGQECIVNNQVQPTLLHLHGCLCFWIICTKRTNCLHCHVSERAQWTSCIRFHVLLLMSIRHVSLLCTTCHKNCLMFAGTGAYYALPPENICSYFTRSRLNQFAYSSPLHSSPHTLCAYLTVKTLTMSKNLCLQYPPYLLSRVWAMD